MCGIVGVRDDWLVQHGRGEADVQRAVAALAWRGPDDQGVVRAGPWWLGCARLAISHAASRQPVERRGGRFVGVLNGAVTNARELWRDLLPRAERRPQPPNDAWLPLLCVAARRRDRLEGLEGHHAYAVVDTETGELVLGQDRFGEKPLFCFVARWQGRPTIVAFASTTGALAALGVPAWRPGRRWSEWFRQGWTQPATQRFDARARLGPLPRRGRPWSSLDAIPRRASATPAVTRSEPTPDAVRRELVAAVARCADTQEQVGLSLSGGLDSSCLAAALHANGITAPVFQLRADGDDGDERAAAAAVAARLGLPLTTVDVTPAALDALPHLTALADQPLGDPSILAVHQVALAAAAAGVRVLLTGEGADELFLGYRRYAALRWLPRLPSRFATAGWSMRGPARLLRAACAEDPAQTLLEVTPPAFRRSVLDGDAARQAHRSRAPARTPTEAATGDLGGYLRCDLLPKVDIATMAAGIESRCPFLAASFADVAPASRSTGKTILRAAFADVLPRATLRLRKKGFALPLDRWFRGDLPWLDLLRERRTLERPHLQPGGVARAIDLHRAGHHRLGHALYLLVAAEIFLRHRERRRGHPAGPGKPSGQRTIDGSAS
jgi:asparagine synthase (glutamine-hydrolysing)